MRGKSRGIEKDFWILEIIKAGTGCDRARYFRVISCDIFAYFHTHIRIIQYFLTIKNPRYYVVSRNYVGFVQMEAVGAKAPAFATELTAGLKPFLLRL